MEAHDKIKIFEYDKYMVIFNGEDMTLKLLPLDLSRVCKSEDVDYTGNAQEASLSFDHVREIPGDVLPDIMLRKNISEQKQELRPAIHRLSFNVSNTCNMACKYCYANGGIYYTQGMLMDKETALNAVNFAARSFSKIDHINFFGGEPTLNQQIIELVCEYFIYLHRKGILPYLPRFGLTTNAYNISNRMFQTLHTYNFSASISLDGPKDIHDRLRLSKNGSGTYDVVVENVKKIIDMGIVPEFECTYTGEHYRSGIDLQVLMDFFYDNFQCRTLHCPMVAAEQNSRWFIPLETATELYAEAIRYSIYNLTQGIPKSISIATRLLNSLTTRTPCHYCPAGKSSITINADGNIYACFMLMRGAGFCLGNVNGKQHGFGPPDAINILLRDANKSQIPACRDCWAQSLCFGCLGEDISREGFLSHRSVISGRSGLCDFKRKLREVFLMSVAEAYIRFNQDKIILLKVK